jgi:hypothetical protein
MVTFALASRVYGSGVTTVSHTAYVTLPDGVTDPDPTTNATDADRVSCRIYLPLAGVELQISFEGSPNFWPFVEEQSSPD